MKMIRLIALVLAMSAMGLLNSCDKTNDAVNTNAAAVATAGTWRVTLFTDSGNNETSDFNGYTFTFNANGTIVAMNGGITKTGTWSQSSNKLIINLGAKDNTNKPLGELTDDWQIESVTDNVINLKDDNPASNERLQFTKN